VSGARLLLGIAIGFFSTRLLLQCVGFVDYGILTALGATGLLTTVIASGLANAAQRHLTFEIGGNNQPGAIRIYSSSLAVFLVFSIIVLIVGVLFKPLVFSVLKAPVDRIGAAKIVYMVMIVQWMIATFTAPCYALMQAHQHLASASIFGLAQKIFQFLIIVLVYYLQGDQLVLYSFLLLLVNLVTGLSVVIYTRLRYKIFRPKIKFVSWRDSRRLMEFATWSLMSMFVYQLRQQGTIFVTNVFFGPAINSAYAIATTLSGNLHQASGAVHSAIQPAITTAHAKANHSQFAKLLSAGCRYPFYSSLFLFIPVMVETRFFLKFWLGDYPPGTIEFARLASVAAVFGLLINGYGLAMPAVDKMKELVLVTASIQLVSFIGGTLAIYMLDLEAPTLPWAIIIGVLILFCVVPAKFGAQLGFSMIRWLKEILLPCVMVAGVALLAGLITQSLFSQGIARLLLVVMASSLSLFLSIFFIGSNDSERRIVVEICRKKIMRKV
jgi:O-antigen/teichoic acid export membrane protein